MKTHFSFPLFFFNADAGGGTGGSGASEGGGAAGGTTLLAGAGAGEAGGGTGTGVAAPYNWAKEDGTFSADWISKLPPDIQGAESLKSIGTINDLAKSYVATKALVGTKLSAPGTDATPEQLAAWRKTVGAPETPEGYLGEAKTIRPESVPEALWDKTGEKEFLGIAHKHSLPPAAVKDIMDYYGKSIAGGLAKSAEQEGAVLASEGVKLKTAWGRDYDANLALASRVAQTIGLDPATHPAFTDAGVVQAFAKMGKLLSEDRLVKGEGGSGINGSIAERVRDIADPKSMSQVARDYRGENGQQRQTEAQAIYHQLLASQQQK